MTFLDLFLTILGDIGVLLTQSPMVYILAIILTIFAVRIIIYFVSR